MELLWFLLGLLVGLTLLGWYHFQLNARLKQLLRYLKPDALRWSLKTTSSLSRAIADYGLEQQRLAREVERWRWICQIAPMGFLQVDEDNQLISCNLVAGQLLGIQSQSSPQARLLLELVRSYELDQLIEQTRLTGTPNHKEWTFHPVFADPSLLSQQTPRPLKAYAVPLDKGAVGVFLENRQESVSLAQQRDRWISDVAHELKTPLTSIRLVAETLQCRLEPPLREWVDRLLKETIRLSSLVQDLLDLSQLEAQPTLHSTQRTVDLPHLIQSTWMGLEPLARRKQVQLDYIGPKQLILQADESRLHRALLNLLDNSIKYSPNQHTIRVQVEVRVVEPALASQHVVIDVIDDGPGFPESALPHIFERFYRADPSRTRSQVSLGSREMNPLPTHLESSFTHTHSEALSPSRLTESAVSNSSGSGLGLAIVRQIVEAHGGWVKASNHPDTHGAWLQLFIPIEGEIA